MEREWDQGKAVANQCTRGGSSREAGTVLGDPFAITFEGPAHSEGAHRFLTSGVPRMNRLLVASHIEQDGPVRIVSAGEATGHERRIYEDG